MVEYVGHVLSSLIYTAVIVSAIYAAITLKRSSFPACYHWVPRVFIGSLIIQSSIFLSLQVEWWIATNPPDQNVRLAFDLINGLTLVTSATALNVYLGWKYYNTKGN